MQSKNIDYLDSYKNYNWNLFIITRGIYVCKNKSNIDPIFLK